MSDGVFEIAVVMLLTVLILLVWGLNLQGRMASRRSYAAPIPVEGWSVYHSTAPAAPAATAACGTPIPARL